MTSRTRAFTLAGVALVVALLVALAACGGDDGSDRTGGDGGKGTTTTAGPTTTAKSTATTTGAPQGPREQAVAAYNASWVASFKALDPPKVTPEIGKLMTGDALDERVTSIATRARTGNRLRGSMQTHPKVVSASATQVVIDDCTVENSTEYDRNGAVVESTKGAVTNFRVTVVREGSAWKVSHFDRREAPCTPA
ncbi:MAG TPA: hypothetical protein VKB57_05415 [Acidimicrobiales bacterium]|nr:hypothetical protein [Acidimicrobiales bacterium]